MDQPINSLKLSALIAIFAMTILLTGSVIFYKERILFLDASLISFDRIGQHISTDVYRYGTFITQIVPLLGGKIHLSLKAILIAYSACFYFFYLAIILLLVYRFKQYGMAVILALFNVLFVSDSWYWANSEIQQGIAWMFLFFAVAFNMANKKTSVFLQIPVFVLLSAISVFSHPLLIISILAFWIFFLFNRKSWPYTNHATVLYTVLLLAVAGLKFYLSTQDSYDSGRIHNPTQLNTEAILNIFRSRYADTFWHDCLTNYWWLFILFITGSLALVKEKKYWVILWTILFSAGFFILACNTYGPNAYDYHVHFYMEYELSLTGLFVSAPFVFYYLPKLTSQKALLSLTAIFLTRFVYIAMAFPMFHKRIEFVESGLAQMRKSGLTKVILKKSKRAEDKLMMDWALPYESLLSSKLNGDNPQLTFIEIPEEKINDVIPPDNNVVMGPWGAISNINSFYFNPDTTCKYSVMSYDELFDK